METNPIAPLRVFVYGSLKGGYRNHAAFCQGYESFRAATVVGRLYRQADGYPMLIVPPKSILAMGTSDYQGDLQKLVQLESSIDGRSLAAEESGAKTAPEDWQEIRGEIYQWPAGHAESSKILARLDRLEDFYPSDLTTKDNRSLYQRVIVMAHHDKGKEPVWTFVAPSGELPAGCTPMGRSWP